MCYSLGASQIHIYFVESRYACNQVHYAGSHNQTALSASTPATIWRPLLPMSIHRPLGKHSGMALLGHGIEWPLDNLCRTGVVLHRTQIFCDPERSCGGPIPCPALLCSALEGSKALDNFCVAGLLSFTRKGFPQGVTFNQCTNGYSPVLHYFKTLIKLYYMQ